MRRRTRLLVCTLLTAALCCGAPRLPAMAAPAPTPPAPSAESTSNPVKKPADPGRDARFKDAPKPARSPRQVESPRNSSPPRAGEKADSGQSTRPGESSQPGEPAQPEAQPETEKPPKPDLTPRLREIYERRAQRFVTGPAGPSLKDDFLLERRTAQWALQHEEGKYRYVEAWARERGVKFVEAKTEIWVKELKVTEDRARFYVAQSLMLGYQYPGEEAVNRFGVGSRHIIELHRTADDRWLIGLEWYSDPLGDETETPAETPKRKPSTGRVPQALAGLLAPTAEATALSTAASAGRLDLAYRYDREGAVRYMDTYCGLAAGCGNGNKYNTKFRNYMGEGGDCANFVSQALRHGGKVPVPYFTRVDGLVSHLRYTGKADLVAKGDFATVWRIAAGKPDGFRSFVRPGDVLAYQYKDKMAHVALITGFDSRGYPLGNSHTADRYHVPFDLGWDRKTIYWFVQMRD